MKIQSQYIARAHFLATARFSIEKLKNLQFRNEKMMSKKQGGNKKEV